MKPVQQQMLESLGSGVRPVDLGESAADSSNRFDGMLASAVQGPVRTDLGVTFAPSASGMFDMQEQEQIARAVDIAAAAGSEQALILHDRHTLRVDVRNRVVLEAPVFQSESLVSDIDAFVCAQLPECDEDASELSVETVGVSVPARVVRNASLARTLAQTGDAADS